MTKRKYNNTPIWTLSKYIHEAKDWSSLSDLDKKSFNKIQMLNYLSMHSEYIDVINGISQYVLELSDEQTYTVLIGYFGYTRNPFIKYIKNTKKIAKSKLLKSAINDICDYYLDSARHIENMIFETYQLSISEILDILRKKAYSDEDMEAISKELVNILNQK